MNKEIIITLLNEAQEIVEKYEKRYLDSEEKEILQLGLLEILGQLESFQKMLFDELAGINYNLDKLSEIDYTFYRELNNFILKIKLFLQI